MENYESSTQKDKSIQKRKKRSIQHCEACGTQLYIKGGYANTGLCGPCCMGESALIDEAGQTW